MSLFIDRNAVVYFLLESNIFFKMHQAKSKINPSLTTYLEYNMILFCVDFIVSLQNMTAGKTLLNYTNLFFPNDYQQNDKI